MKDFFIHKNKGPGKMPNRAPRGFTAHVCEDHIEHNKVKLSIAFCSPKDEFNKKLGRENAIAKEHKVVKKRDIPYLIAAAWAICLEDEQNMPYYVRNYYYLYKFML